MFMSSHVGRRAMVCGLALAASALIGAGAAAQSISSPVRLLVGYGAGSSVDIVARVVAERMQSDLNRPVLVENKAGASGRIAAELVKNAKPDGATLLVAPHGAMTLFPHVFAKLPYDPDRSFVPIAQLASFDFGLFVGSGVPAGNLNELKTWARANPTLATYGSPGVGTSPHFLAAALGVAEGMSLTHVPYNSPPDIMIALLSGQIAMAAVTVQDGLEAYKAGKVKLLGVSGESRSKQVPDVPTFIEQGIKLELAGWFGLFAPAGTPEATSSILERSATKAMQDPDIRAKLAAMTLNATGLPGASLGRIQKSESEFWRSLVAQTGFTPER